MDIYKQNLENFISSIESKSITTNEIVVGNIAQKVIIFLENKNIILSTDKISIDVKAYHHIKRDFKQKLNKAIPQDIINEIYKSLHNPYKILFDNQKEKLNLIYVDKAKHILFKIVIQPNYKTKKGLINRILTAGIIEYRNLKSKYYEII